MIPRTDTSQHLAASERALNGWLDELQGNYDIDQRSDHSITGTVQIIAALVHARRRSGYTDEDRWIIEDAVWHPACLLSDYRDPRSEAYQRDSYQYGVYVIFEGDQDAPWFEEVRPVFVEAVPRYPGMSAVLSQRLKNHAKGTFYSNPAEHVIRDFLQTCTQAEQAAYAVASRSEQLELRVLAMTKRGLWVRTTHCANKKAADKLEHATIRQYKAYGYELWNDIDYHTGT